MACELPILGLVLLNDEKAKEIAVGFTNEGTNLLEESLYDKLFIITPKEEMTPFEKELARVIGFAISRSVVFPDDYMEAFIKSWSGSLLSLAREQFVKDGYVIEKKAFHDAVKKVDPEVMKAVSENVDMKEALRLEYEKGRADVLKDLPRWENVKSPAIDDAKVWVDALDSFLASAQK